MAFELSKLVEKLKAKGLDIAEDAAEHVVESVFDWVEEGVVETPNQYDNLLLAVIPSIKKIALDQVDKIDGEEG